MLGHNPRPVPPAAVPLPAGAGFGGGRPCTGDACRVCAAATVLPLTGDGEQVIHDATMGNGALHGSCALPGDFDSVHAPERIYRLELPVAARLRADTFGTPFDTVLYLRTARRGPIWPARTTLAAAISRSWSWRPPPACIT
jgi:hypothetical protein